MPKRVCCYKWGLGLSRKASGGVMGLGNLDLVFYGFVLLDLALPACSLTLKTWCDGHCHRLSSLTAFFFLLSSRLPVRAKPLRGCRLLPMLDSFDRRFVLEGPRVRRANTKGTGGLHRPLCLSSSSLSRAGPHPSRCHSTAVFIPSMIMACARSGLMISWRNFSCCKSSSILRVAVGNVRYFRYGGRVQYCR